MVEPEDMSFKTCYLCREKFVPTLRHYNGELHPEFCESCNLKASLLTIGLIALLASLAAWAVVDLSR